MRRIKILTRKIKKNIRRFSRKFKKPFFAAVLLLAAVSFFILFYKNSDGISNIFPGMEKSKKTVQEENKVVSLDGTGFVGKYGKAGYDWLYGSGNIPMEDIYENLIRADGSVYEQMNGKERKEWLAEMYSALGWEKEPDTVTREEAVIIGGLCGFDETEISGILLNLTEDLP